MGTKQKFVFSLDGSNFRNVNLYCMIENNVHTHTHTYTVGRVNSVGIATRYGFTVGGSNPGGSELFNTRLDRP